jgi:hypothetical protein
MTGRRWRPFRNQLVLGAVQRLLQRQPAIPDGPLALGGDSREPAQDGGRLLNAGIVLECPYRDGTSDTGGDSRVEGCDRDGDGFSFPDE